jgi:plasmid maintenance system antidote protein VapI
MTVKWIKKAAAKPATASAKSSRPKTPKTPKVVKGQWFYDRLADKDLTQRVFAKLIRRNPSAVTRMFNGERRWTPEDIIAFASLAGVERDEVLVRLGIQPELVVSGNVPIVGSVDKDGAVHLGGQIDAPRKVQPPPEFPEGGTALRVKTGDAFDGWLVYAAPMISRVSPDLTGRLVVATLMNKGPTVVGILRRGYTKGTHTIGAWIPGAKDMESVLLETAAPVLWVKCGG